MSKTKVLVVDDSALIRKLLSEILASDPGLEVVGTACDPYAAREKIKSLEPDVLTLDVEMPRMDGLSFLEKLMRLRPMPVVMVSSLTEKGAEVTLRALEIGAVDFVAKPKIGVAKALEAYRDELIFKVKSAAKARLRTGGVANLKVVASNGLPVEAARPKFQFKTTDRIVAIGASTGGTEALREVLSTFPADGPPVVIAQHIPLAFSRAFADRLNANSAMRVSEAEEGQELRRGFAYVAPGDSHLKVGRNGARYVCRLSDSSPVNRHRPSVDVLFRSVAKNAGPNSVGVILTGMGKDGAAGLKEMRESGARTIAQDEASSVVWGMPGSAVEIDAAEKVLSLDAVTRHILRLTAA